MDEASISIALDNVFGFQFWNASFFGFFRTEVEEYHSRWRI